MNWDLAVMWALFGLVVTTALVLLSVGARHGFRWWEVRPEPPSSPNDVASGRPALGRDHRIWWRAVRRAG